MIFGKRNNRKGFIRIIISIMALFFLALTFVIFFFLYKWSAVEMSQNPLDYDFKSLSTELVLKTFLRTRVSDQSIRSPAPFIKGYTTYADLISWTCSEPKDTTNHKLLASDRSAISVKKFFARLYNKNEDGASKWGLKIIYSEPKIDPWTFGNAPGYEYDVIEGIKEASGSEDSFSYWNNNVRWKNFASQVIPCRNGGLANVLLFTDEDGINQDRLLEMMKN
ncbi:MAG: hypothetical protein V1866_03145 [archaeon]